MNIFKAIFRRLGIIKRAGRERAGFAGVYHAECYDANGNLKWQDTFPNLIVNAGLDSILNVNFHGATQITTWYLGLIRDDNYSGIAAGDTLASHAGWEEANEYTGDRKEWTEGAASSQSMTNAATVDFTINDTETMKGAFLCSASTGTSGTLMSAGLFTQGDRAVVATDVLKLTYTITAADA